MRSSGRMIERRYPLWAIKIVLCATNCRVIGIGPISRITSGDEAVGGMADAAAVADVNQFENISSTLIPIRKGLHEWCTCLPSTSVTRVQVNRAARTQITDWIENPLVVMIYSFATSDRVSEQPANSHVCVCVCVWCALRGILASHIADPTKFCSGNMEKLLSKSQSSIGFNS